MKWKVLLLAIFTIIIFCMCLKQYRKYITLVRIKSLVDGNIYSVVNKSSQNKSIESADALALINKRILTLIESMYSKYSTNPNYDFVKYLKDRYSKDIISEAVNDPRYTTYTVDKHDIHVCLRTRDSNDTLYDINTLMYVVLHELAHLCNFDKNGEMIIGHGYEFLRIFRILTENAMELGLYTKIDYNTKPKEYCGMMINSSIV